MAVLVALPSVVMGAEPEPEPEPEAENTDEGVVTDAQGLYEEGQVLYSAADYTGAIDKFTQVLALISRPEAVFDDEVRGMLLYSLATAHKRAFNVEPEPRYLRQAHELYGRIVDEAAVHDYSDELVRQAAVAREEVDQMLKEQQKRAREETVPVEPIDPSPGPVTDPVQDDPRRPGRALTITGIGVAGLGLAASGLWVRGLVGAGRATDEIDASTSLDAEDGRIDAFDRGARSNTLIIAGAVVSGALVATGVALIIADLVAITEPPDEPTRVDILLGDPESTLGLPMMVPLDGAGIPSVGDLEGDGIDDLAATDSARNAVRVLLGPYDAASNPIPTSIDIDERPFSVLMHDLDGDGNLDLLVAFRGGDDGFQA